VGKFWSLGLRLTLASTVGDRARLSSEKMMDILKYWNRSSLVVLVVVALTGCGGGGG
jgi:hypothetical protein